MEEKNYYEILEIATDASPNEVHEGYMRAKSAYSQDSLALYSLMSKEECNNILEMIDEAYAIISDPKKRSAYDDARGITQTYEADNFTTRSTRQDIRPPSSTEAMNQEKSSGPNSIRKIVATNKYALDYHQDVDFEKEIEQTTEFSGEFLQKVREYKNVDVPRMSEMTKVSKTYIINIEKEDLEKLPALVYVRGFVYQYAKCLKLNPELVATSYVHRLKSLKEETS